MDIMSLLSDRQLTEEMMDLLETGNLPTPFDPTVDQATIRSIIHDPEGFEGVLQGSEAESIIKLFGRPVLAIRAGTFDSPASETLRARLERARSLLNAVIPSVGRIEVKNHPTYDWVGTAWLVGPEMIVTNRHVAETFSRQNGSGFVFRKNNWGRTIGARIDFIEEYQQPHEAEFKVEEIRFIEPDGGPDLALLRIEVDDDLDGRSPIGLADEALAGRDVAVIGYPARDSRIPEPKVMERIFGDVFDVKRLAPGKITKVSAGEVEHDCSTLGGNSGSVVLDLESGKAVGLHFAGKYKTANYAVPAHIVRDRVDRHA